MREIETEMTGLVNGLARGRVATLIAGPTASGKSRLALKIAERFDGIIVNADSMQVYDSLRILTARPDQSMLEACEHRLYGYWPGKEHYSAGHWLTDMRSLLDELRARDRHAVIVGGTGLYFRALLGGLSPMPKIPDDIRRHYRETRATTASADLHALLSKRDPVMAERLQASDRQRIVRALEVLEASGQSLSSFQSGGDRPLVDPAQIHRLVLCPDRALLHRQIATRFHQMLEQGAVEEVIAFQRLGLSAQMPVTRAIGVRELSALNAGHMNMDCAIERAIIATRQYAKRQQTWFRNQLDTDWLPVF